MEQGAPQKKGDTMSVSYEAQIDDIHGIGWYTCSTHDSYNSALEALQVTYKTISIYRKRVVEVTAERPIATRKSRRPWYEFWG
jgi:hypothetical protein